MDISAIDKENAENAAVECATRWLILLDAANLEASWEEAAQHLKSSVSKAQWTKMLRARSALGELQSRKIISAEYAEATVPGATGATNGRFVVIHYQSSFEHKSAALEMITPMLEEDGCWRVSGYSVR